jgi:hypothetical protein
VQLRDVRIVAREINAAVPLLVGSPKALKVVAIHLQSGARHFGNEIAFHVQFHGVMEKVSRNGEATCERGCPGG